MAKYLPILAVSLAGLIPLHAETLRVTTLCELVAHPADDHRQRIEITAFVSYGFEDFKLFDPRCPEEFPSVWVDYGGKLSPGTIYCCDVPTERSRDTPLVVEDIETSIVMDRNLERFDHLLQTEGDTVVHATLRGRFFARESENVIGSGYGHFGLYSLFVIEQVVSVDDHDQREIDYRASPDQPELGGVGCYTKPIETIEPPEAIRLQREAESGGRAWAFIDPRRVAMEQFRRMVGRSPRLQVRELRKGPGNIIYEGRISGDPRTYWVIVSRPYWLTFYAATRERVLWIPIAAYENGCE